MMNKKTFCALLCGATILGASAYEIFVVRTINGAKTIDASQTKEIKYSEDKANVEVVNLQGEVFSTPTAGLNNITFVPEERLLTVTFNDTEAVVENGYDYGEVNVTREGNKVTVNANTDAAPDIKCVLKGASADGQFKVYGAKAVDITLQDLNLANTSGSAINIQSGEAVTLTLEGDNVLADSKKYSTPDGESEKGTIHSAPAITIQGDGSLTFSALKKHVLCSDGLLTIDGGKISVTSSASDGLHSVGFTMNGGEYTSVETVGDGIDADTGAIIINGGKIDVTIPTLDTKGIKADSDITINGGDIKLTIPSDTSKGIKTKTDCYINGGTITAEASGNAVVTDGDPSYCTVIKTDGNFTMTDGTLLFTHTGMGGKGVSADGNATFQGGNITMTCSGNGEKYTNTYSEDDCYSSTCVTVDSDLYIYGGTFNLLNTGTAGKCLKSDLNMVIGNETSGPDITAKTTGAQILVTGSSSSSGGGGVRPGAWPGWGDNADYSNPKVVKSDANLTVNNGTLNLTSTVEGGEGLESKDILTINGGEILINTYDDCINAKNHIQVNGGKVRCLASNNDAIDSNGTLTIAGGYVIAMAAKAPECGFDCDNNTFAITGGTVFAIGGDTSTPTTSKCTQRVAIYKNASLAKNAVLTVVNSNGEQALSFLNNSNLTSGTILMSSPLITSGTNTIYKAGTLTGGESWQELTVGAEYTPGTSVKTFNSSSMVTSF